MPQSDPLIFAYILALGVAAMGAGAWAVTSVLRDDRMARDARLVVLALLIVFFPVAGIGWAIATAAGVPERLRTRHGLSSTALFRH